MKTASKMLRKHLPEREREREREDLRDVGLRYSGEHLLHPGIDVVVDGVPEGLQQVILAGELLCRVRLERLADLRERLAFHPDLCCRLCEGGSAACQCLRVLILSVSMQSDDQLMITEAR